MKHFSVCSMLLVWACLFSLPTAGGEHQRNSAVEPERPVYRFTYLLNSSEFAESLGDNHRELSRLDHLIGQTQHPPAGHIEQITLTGYSSIDGSNQYNETLARRRAEQLLNYLQDRYPALGNCPHHIAWVGEDWQTFANALRKSKIEGREEVLDIIRNVNAFDQRERLIRKLNGGQTYDEIARKILSGLRRVEVEIVYTPKEIACNDHKPIEETQIAEHTQPTETLRETREVQEAPEVREVQEVQEARHFRLPLAIKTNLLLWAGVVPVPKLDHTTPVANLALEYFINNQWSVEAGGYYSNWHYNHSRAFQGITGIRLEPRYRHALPCQWMEVYAGPYARFGEYDVQRLGNSTQTTNHTGSYWDAGLSTGFYFQLLRGLGIEAGARAGYLRTNAKTYTQYDGCNWLEGRKAYHKIKVTDLNISVVYRFNAQ